MIIYPNRSEEINRNSRLTSFKQTEGKLKFRKDIFLKTEREQSETVNEDFRNNI